jgi:hypothetical protein
VNPGSIVQCRSREWVLLPSDQEDLLFLRPLTGATDEIVAVHKGLPEAEVLRLLAEAQPDANIGPEEKRELTAAALAGYEKLDATIKQNLQGRAEALTEAHRRIRQAVSLKVRGLTVKPQMPPDLLGLLVLQPVVVPPQA